MLEGLACEVVDETPVAGSGSAVTVARTLVVVVALGVLVALTGCGELNVPRKAVA